MRKKEGKKINCLNKSVSYLRVPGQTFVCSYKENALRRSGLVQNSPSSKRITDQLKFSKVKIQEIKLVEFRAEYLKNQYDT